MGISAPLWQTSDDELIAAVQAVAIRRRQTDYELLRLTAELDSRRIAPGKGYASTEALLMHIIRITRKEARHQIARAADLFTTTTLTGSVIDPVLPQTAETLARGEISTDHIDVIRTTLADLPHLDAETRGKAEEVMLTRAAEDDPRALARFAPRVRDIVDPDGPPPPDDEPHRPERQLRRRIRRDGTMDVSGHLDAETAQLFENLLKPFEKPHPEGDDTRGHTERAGDALQDVLKMAANCPDLPTHNGVRTEIAFTIDFNELRHALDDTVLTGGSKLTAREARRIACDARIIPVVMGGTSIPLDVAVPAYETPAHIRRALVLRDRGCSFPSCERPASTCDSHHIVEFDNGGPTKLDNLALICPHHHRLIHRSQWQVEMTSDGRPHFIPPEFLDPLRRPRRNTLHEHHTPTPMPNPWAA